MRGQAFSEGRACEPDTTFLASPRASILVVEDNPVLRLTATLLLEEAGHVVHEALTGDEALAMIEQSPRRYTHLFTDIEMPGSIDGLRLATLVSSLYDHIVVIVTSGDATKDVEAFQHCARFIAKPWTPIDILNLVIPVP